MAERLLLYHILEPIRFTIRSRSNWEVKQVIRIGTLTGCSHVRTFLSNFPLVDKSIGVGRTFLTVVLLPEEPCSWAPILDQQRFPTEQTPVKVAIAQLQALKPLLAKRQLLLLADR